VRPLPLAFYARPAAVVARALLGKRLVSTVGGARCALRIVEVEAYIGPDDPACHAFGWHRSARNETLYGRPGLLYVYFTYGMHWCANVVTEREGFPAAVLLRAGEPLEGLEAMRRRRRRDRDTDLASGPAKLAQALGISRDQDGHPLSRAPLWIADGPPVPAHRRATAVRIGVRLGADRLLRYYERGNPHVSAPRD
jgi:DNA-3-methyladenine glycosylase